MINVLHIVSHIECCSMYQMNKIGMADLLGNSHNDPGRSDIQPCCISCAGVSTHRARYAFPEM